MKKLSLLLFLCALVAISLSLASPAKGQTDGRLKKSKRAIPNHYIVVLNDEVGKVNDILPSSLKTEMVSRVSSELASFYGGKIEKVYANTIKGYAVEMPAQAAEKLSQDARVKYVEEDFVVHKEETQTNAPWGIDRIDQRYLPLNSTYNYDTTGAGVHAYVIDTGIRSTHAEFGGRVVFGADFVNDGQNGNDCDGHGTHVAGILGGATYGVAKQVMIHNVRVLNCQGDGEGSAVLAAVEWVTANNVKPAVVNMSLGSDQPSQSVEDAITNSLAQGVNYALAAGNSSTDACTHSPGGRVPNAVTVGASAKSDGRWFSSNYGPCVDIYAPGEGILSAWNTSDTATATASGTSMAAPHVAGVMARFLQTNPSVSPAQVKSSLMNWSTQSGILGARLLYSKVSLEAPSPAILLSPNSVANPYPATYTVSGVSGPISTIPGSVRVKINGFSHGGAQEVSLVLVGPSGAALQLQGRNGFNNFAANDVSYTISDAATKQMSGITLEDGAVYKPTVFTGTPLPFPSPGPGTAYNFPIYVNCYSCSPADGSGTLSMTFGGTDPNGVWKLYAISGPLAAGSIESWSVEFTNPPPSPPVTQPPPAYETSASYLGADIDTKGDSSNKYGSEARWKFNDYQFLPNWANISASGHYLKNWTYKTNEPRAFQRTFGFSPTEDRYAAAFYSPGDYAASQFELNFDFTDGQAHRLSLYCLDWDSNSRQQTFEVVDATTGGVLDTRTISNFNGGIYLSWQARGRFKIRVKNAGGASINAVVSGIFVDAPPPAPYERSVSFAGFDAITKGNWIGTYGKQDYRTYVSFDSLPAWISSIRYPSGKGFSSSIHTWASPTTDIRALQSTGNGNRSAGALYTSRYLEFNINLTDGQIHRLAAYNLDWDNINRQQTIELVDSITNEVLDTRTITNFSGGVYAVWQVKGRFTLRLRNAGGNNAVLSAMFLDPETTPLPAPVDTSASYVGEDGYTKGNWVGNYGAQGYSVIGDTTSLPAYAQLSVTGQSAYTWAASTTDVRALKKASNNNDRIASTYYSPTQFDLNFYLTDGQTHRLALYSLDWEGGGRRQTFELVNTETGAFLDARTISNFNNGRYVVWNVKGKFTVRVKNSGGVPANAVLSGIFFDAAGAALPAPPPPADASASFVGVDSATKGNWIGYYGTRGYKVVGDTTEIGSWSKLSITGQQSHTWADPTIDARGLKKYYKTNERIASTFYAPTQMDLNFEFTDGQTYRLALYSVDWDSNSRQQTFELVNTDSGAVLDTRSITNFNGGRYVAWLVKGKFTVRVKNAGGNNAVLSGIFIDPQEKTLPAPIPAAGSFVGFDNYSKGDWLGKYGAQGYKVIGDRGSEPGWGTWTTTGQSEHTWASPTADVRALHQAVYSERVAATLYSPTEFTVDFIFEDTQFHRLALYSVDWEGSARAQTLELVNTATGELIDTRTISNFNGGVYVVWQVKGNVTVRVKKVAGANAVLSGWFIDAANTALPTPPPPPPPDPTSASFIRFDTNTRGNWLSGYGAQGYSIVNDATSLPNYAQLSATNQNAYTWNASTADPRALVKAAVPNERIASTFYSANQFELNFNLTDGQTHRLALYALDWEGNTRQQVFELVNTDTGAVLDTRTISSFNGGVYVVWEVRGKVTVRAKRVSGPNAVLSGIFLDSPAADEATAAFVGFDSTSKGNWMGSFGSQGYAVIGDVITLPAWSRLLTTGQNAYTWASSTADVRGLTKASNNSDRIASTFYAPTQMDLSFYLTDEQTHRLSVYSLDWEGNSREQTFEIINSATGAVLDTRTINNFNGGIYAVWQVKGKFTVRIKKTAGPNAVVSGVFIDNP